ncbi:MAG TPA: hypothetical protein VJ111_10550 [Chitinophagaceae bacterium]|nr:hypothetical protein [Chitinophagaceae bacterium]
MNIVELRNYLLKPGTRDSFIEYFKDHFVESQQVLSAYIPGLFRIKDEDNRFFWIRGFDSMQERSRFLPTFYGGEVWKEFGPAANDMMLEWHDVYLIKPLVTNKNSFPLGKGIFVLDYYKAKDKQFNKLVDLFNTEYIPLLNKLNVNTTTLWICEMSENDFPGLPVYQDQNLLVVITGYENEPEYESTLNVLNTSGKEITIPIKEMVKEKNSLILYPAEKLNIEN